MSKLQAKLQAIFGHPQNTERRNLTLLWRRRYTFRLVMSKRKEALISSEGPDIYTNFTWEKFSKAFTNQFCPQIAIRQLEEEFMNLKQGNMSVRDYTARFLEKSRFAEYYVSTEARKVERYIFGLNSSIRGLVIAMRPDTFTSAVDAAETTERDRGRDVSERSFGKRKWEGPVFDPKKSRFSRFDVRPPFRPTERPCPKCNKVHQGDCRVDTRNCYKCGKPGHIARDCRVTRFCYHCNSPDHLQYDCPLMRTRGSNVSGSVQGGRGEPRKAELPKAKGRAFQMTTVKADKPNTCKGVI